MRTLPLLIAHTRPEARKRFRDAVAPRLVATAPDVETLVKGIASRRFDGIVVEHPLGDVPADEVVARLGSLDVNCPIFVIAEHLPEAEREAMEERLGDGSAVLATVDAVIETMGGSNDTRPGEADKPDGALKPNETGEILEVAVTEGDFAEPVLFATEETPASESESRHEAAVEATVSADDDVVVEATMVADDDLGDAVEVEAFAVECDAEPENEPVQAATEAAPVSNEKEAAVDAAVLADDDVVVEATVVADDDLEDAVEVEAFAVERAADAEAEPAPSASEATPATEEKDREEAAVEEAAPADDEVVVEATIVADDEIAVVATVAAEDEPETAVEVEADASAVESASEPEAESLVTVSGQLDCDLEVTEEDIAELMQAATDAENPPAEHLEVTVEEATVAAEDVRAEPMAANTSPGSGSPRPPEKKTAPMIPVPELVKLAENALQQHELTTAISLLKQARDADPTNGTALALLGWSVFRAQPTSEQVRDGARGLLQQAMELQPDAPRPHVFIARILRLQGELHAAQGHLKQALTLDENCAEAKVEMEAIDKLTAMIRARGASVPGENPEQRPSTPSVGDSDKAAPGDEAEEPGAQERPGLLGRLLNRGHS